MWVGSYPWQTESFLLFQRQFLFPNPLSGASAFSAQFFFPQNYTFPPIFSALPSPSHCKSSWEMKGNYVTLNIIQSQNFLCQTNEPTAFEISTFQDFRTQQNTVQILCHNVPERPQVQLLIKSLFPSKSSRWQPLQSTFLSVFGSPHSPQNDL